MADGQATLPGVENVVDDTWQNTNSWGTFCAAVAMGNQGLRENYKKFNEKSDPEYQLVPIAAARKQGLLPIPFDPETPFVTSGLRLGTPAATTRGFGVAEFKQVGGIIAEVLNGIAQSQDGKAPLVEAAIKERVKALTDRFPIY